MAQLTLGILLAWAVCGNAFQLGLRGQLTLTPEDDAPNYFVSCEDTKKSYKAACETVATAAFCAKDADDIKTCVDLPKLGTGVTLEAWTTTHLTQTCNKWANNAAQQVDTKGKAGFCDLKAPGKKMVFWSGGTKFAGVEAKARADAANGCVLEKTIFGFLLGRLKSFAKYNTAPPQNAATGTGCVDLPAGSKPGKTKTEIAGWPSAQTIVGWLAVSETYAAAVDQAKDTVDVVLMNFQTDSQFALSELPTLAWKFAGANRAAADFSVFLYGKDGVATGVYDVIEKNAGGADKTTSFKAEEACDKYLSFICPLAKAPKKAPAGMTKPTGKFSFMCSSGCQMGQNKAVGSCSIAAALKSCDI